METKRLIDANKIKYRTVGAGGWNRPENVVSDYEIEKMPTVDAVPVDEFRLHHILIDNEGVPEVKLQFGDRYFILRTDPVDVRQVKRGWWEWITEDVYGCANCGATNHVKEVMGQPDYNYCPNCGAKMDGVSDG